MIESATRLLNTLLPMLYALAVAAYALEFFREDRLAGRVARRLMAFVLGLHLAYLALLTTRYDHLPLASGGELMTMVAFAAAATYVFVERRSGAASTGVFVVSFSFVLQTLSSAFIAPDASFPELLRSPLFAIHTVAAVLGYTAFAVSAIYGGLYLLLYWKLKRSSFGLIYDRLPPLEDLARMSLRATLFGVVFLTVTIGCREACGPRWCFPASVGIPSSCSRSSCGRSTRRLRGFTTAATGAAARPSASPSSASPRSFSPGWRRDSSSTPSTTSHEDIHGVGDARGQPSDGQGGGS